jgi:hypothetical protein
MGRKTGGRKPPREIFQTVSPVYRTLGKMAEQKGSRRAKERIKAKGKRQKEKLKEPINCSDNFCNFTKLKTLRLKIDRNFCNL